MTNRPLPIIDLFAGAGGLGIGATEAGNRLALSVDNDAFSCETLKRNAPAGASVYQGDVTEMTGVGLRELAGLSPTEPLVVVGGAPCQPFSKAAYWVDGGAEAAYRRARARGEAAVKPIAPTVARPDSRRTLVHDYLRLVLESNADGFVFENVPSILHPRNKHIFDALRDDSEAAGYETRTVVANATHYGAPQARQRVFLLASRNSRPDEPVKTHGEGLLPLIGAGDVISRFDTDRYFEPEEVVTGRWAGHLRDVKPGMNYKWHTAWAGHPNPTFVTETRFWNFLLKLDPEKPSWTLPASPGPWTGPFHWTSRRLRTVELAALQGFPDGYEFFGPRRERVRQIGNAVPTMMAAAMVSAVAESVSSNRLAA